MKLTKLAMLATTALLAAGAAMAESKVKVGMITTLSGGGAGLGIDARDGFMLALKLSGSDAVEVVIEDDQRKPEIAVQLADKLIQAENVDVMTGIIWSNLAMAVVPSAVAQDKIYLSLNAGPSALAGKGCHPNYFNVAWQNDNLHEAAGAYAAKAGYSKTFILAPNYPAGTDALTGFKRFYKGAPAGEIYTTLGQTDYAAEIAQIRASGADSVFFFLPGGMGISFMKQYADSGVGRWWGLLSALIRAFFRPWAQRRWAWSIPRNGARTWTTRPTRPLWQRSSKNTGVCRRFMQAKGMTRRTCCFRPSARPMFRIRMRSAPR
jgi:branched-chain amino acid transport system substrate-binding protein